MTIRGKARRTGDIPAHSWAGVPHLRTVRLLNERCVGLLAQAASLMAPAGASYAVEALRQFADRLDYKACQLAGRCPVLLVHLKFHEGNWWDNVGKEPPVNVPMNSPPVLPQETAAPLLWDILSEAWIISRTVPRTASFLFGMSPRVTQTISRLSMKDIEHVVARHARDLRPRWEHNHTFWPRLLRAITGNDNEAMIDIQLHCLSLLEG